MTPSPARFPIRFDRWYEALSSDSAERFGSHPGADAPEALADKDAASRRVAEMTKCAPFSMRHRPCFEAQRMNAFQGSRALGSGFVAAILFAVCMGAPRTATAQVIDVAPPALRLEVAPLRPSPNHFWIPGYWGWGPRGHVWYGGRWELERRGSHWAAARWTHEGRRWHFSPGRFRR